MSNSTQVDQSDIQKFRFWKLVQGNDSVADYYSKLKRRNEVINVSEEYLMYDFLRGLTRENQLCVATFELGHTLDELVEILVRVEKERESDLMSAFKEYIIHGYIEAGYSVPVITEEDAKRLGLKIVPISITRISAQ